MDSNFGYETYENILSECQQELRAKKKHLLMPKQCFQVDKGMMSMYQAHKLYTPHNSKGPRLIDHGTRPTHSVSS